MQNPTDPVCLFAGTTEHVRKNKNVLDETDEPDFSSAKIERAAKGCSILERA
jgi:hypothetical protein